MNIKRAKQEIIDTIQSYLLKDEYGEYVIPTVHQRPVLLLGAPGIGKTQIMEQIAEECRIGLVSYTITHHTRQSAIGLPFIVKENYGGREYSVTSYTMSEIVASVYQKMERTGLKEGILFIDEINCVSETLAPAMLRFLQYKSFGNQEIPEGWIIVAAGNPPEYNKSVHDFDVVTLDRVKKIEVEPQFEVWKEYAYQAGVHQAVISYLNTKPLHFYKMETTVDGRLFATPRGWEDLSRIIKVYEKLDKQVDREVVVQYIQHPEIAVDFADYLELSRRYETDYRIDEIMSGNIPDVLIKKLAHASFDERLGVLGLVTARCMNGFRAFCEQEDFLKKLHPVLLEAKAALEGAFSGQPREYLKDLLAGIREEKEQAKRAELLTRPQEAVYRKVEAFLEETVLDGRLTEESMPFAVVKSRFEDVNAEYSRLYDEAALNLERAFDFLEAAFGAGQEIVLFLTEINMSGDSLRFLGQYECDRYYRYNESLLFEERSREILERF